MDRRLLNVTTKLCFILIATLAGCYNPGVQPCQLACSANKECPDGLACNGQNACAATSATMCNELPIDAPPDLDAAATTVTIEVRDVAGAPLGSVPVVFTDAAGALVAEMPTGPDGKATIELPAGGGATVIRMVPRLNGTPGIDFDVTTYLDLWPGANVVTQAQEDTTLRQVTVTFNPPAGSGQFTAQSSCASAASSSAVMIPVQVPNRCKAFDVFVTAGPTAADPPTHAAVLPAQTSATVSVPVAAFKPTRRVSGTLTNLPGGVNALLGAVPWVTPALPPAVFNPQTMSQVPTSGMINLLTMPMDAGVQTALAVHYAPTPTLAPSFQFVHNRFPPSATTVDRDYAGLIMPWMGKPTLNYSTREMAWPLLAPAGVTTSPPSFFVANARYNHDATFDVSWRLVGAPSRIVQSGNLKAITFPDIPGDRAFEPIGTSRPISSTVTLFQVEPAAVRDTIQLFDAAGGAGLWKIPAVRHISVSISQP